MIKVRVNEKWEGVSENEFQGHLPFNHLAGWAAKQSQNHAYSAFLFFRVAERKVSASKRKKTGSERSWELGRNSKMGFWKRTSSVNFFDWVGDETIFPTDSFYLNCEDHDTKEREEKELRKAAKTMSKVATPGVGKWANCVSCEDTFVHKTTLKVRHARKSKK